MKIALTGDWQLSEQARFSTRLESGATSRLQDQADCIDWIIAEATKQGCTHLGVLGDIFDQRNAVNAPVLDQAGRVFRKTHDAFEETFVLVGNHDSPLRTPSLTSLRVLDGLARIIDAPTVIDCLAFVPWTDDPDDFRESIGIVDAKKAARYLFSHVMVQGAVPAGKGLPPSHLRPQRWDTIFLGDVHEPIELEPNIQYVGAPMQHHYGDAGGERGFWILDTDKDECWFVENELSPRFHIIESTSQLRSVNEGDFVRAQTEDAEVEAAIVAEARKTTRWVESRPIELDETPPRLAVSSSQGHRDVLQSYVAFQLEGREHEALVDTGMAILDEVL